MYKLRIHTVTFLLIFFITFGASAREWYEEHKVIAVYIYNLLEYTTWPDQRPKTICVTKDDKVNSVLKNISKKYTFAIKVINPDGLYDSCSILYIDRETTSYKDILNKADKNNVLTISTNRKFIDKGGIVGIVSQDNKTSLEVNYKKAKEIKLEISAELLEVAKRVLN